MILAFDTSTVSASAALVTADGAVLAEDIATVRTHSEQLLPLLDRVLGQAGVRFSEVDAVACGAGPGSFTGLRIGLATAKGLAFGASKPLHLVSSLAALAYDAACHAACHPGTLLMPCLKARRDEVFVGFFLDGIAVAPEASLKTSELAEACAVVMRRYDGRARFVGEGALAYEAVAAPIAPLDKEAAPLPSAKAVGILAWRRHGVLKEGDPLATAVPTYIRPPEITPRRKNIV